MFKNFFKKYDIKNYIVFRRNKKNILHRKQLILPKIEWIKKDCDCHVIPKGLGWSVKVIDKTGSGKTTFVSAFIDFFINYSDSLFEILIISPTFHQERWNGIRKH